MAKLYGVEWVALPQDWELAMRQDILSSWEQNNDHVMPYTHVSKITLSASVKKRKYVDPSQSVVEGIAFSASMD